MTNVLFDTPHAVIHAEQAEFPAGTSSSSSQTRTMYNGAMWNVHKMQSESHTTRSPCQFKQPVTVHAPEVRVEQSPSASAEPNLITDPGVTPTYTHVVDIHDYKAVSQRSLAAGPAVITRLAVAFIIGNPFAGASLGSTMAGAGFSTLCSETSINMIEQGGDIGRSIQAMQKKNIIKTLARSVAAAGLTGTLGGSAASTSLESFAKEFLARAAVNTTLSIAFDGVKPGEALRQGALTAAVNTVGACIANQIGDMASADMGIEQIGAVTHKLFHTFLGAGLGAATAGITGQDIGLGASSGAVGALVGETGAEFFDSKQLGDLVAATVALMTDQDVGIAYQASNNATTYNYAAHPGEKEDEEERKKKERKESFLKGLQDGAEEQDAPTGAQQDFERGRQQFRESSLENAYYARRTRTLSEGSYTRIVENADKVYARSYGSLQTVKLLSDPSNILYAASYIPGPTGIVCGVGEAAYGMYHGTHDMMDATQTVVSASLGIVGKSMKAGVTTTKMVNRAIHAKPKIQIKAHDAEGIFYVPQAKTGSGFAQFDAKASAITKKAVNPHGNSLKYVGDTHVYAIRDAEGKLYKIGESTKGTNPLGLSKRAEAQAKKIFKQTGSLPTSEIRRVFSTKAEARAWETGVIERFRRMYGQELLSGNKGNR